MTLLAPWYLAGALAAAAIVTALHLFAWQRPPAAMLPTARFVPDGAARATSRAVRPTDLPLLALRVGILLLLGLALARPARTAREGTVARVFVADLSRPASAAVVLDSVRAIRGEGDIVVVVDSLARVASGDSLAPATTGRARGALSSGMIAALRAARTLRQRADSVELVLVSPFGTDAADEATLPIRAEWAGRARIVVTVDASGSGAGTDGFGPVALRAGAGDPLGAALRLAGLSTSPGAPVSEAPPVRVVRDGVHAADSAWAIENGGVIVDWPATVVPDARTAGWSPRPVLDTVGAVVFDEALVAPFERPWRSNALPPGTAVLARWVDGEPAIVERQLTVSATSREPGAENREPPSGAESRLSCIREVRIPVPIAGDLVLRPVFVRLVRRLAEPCGGAVAPPLPAAMLAALRGPAGSPLLATAGLAVVGREERRAPIVPWLLVAAGLAALAELRLRRGPAASAHAGAS